MPGKPRNARQGFNDDDLKKNGCRHFAEAVHLLSLRREIDAFVRFAASQEWDALSTAIRPSSRNNSNYSECNMAPDNPQRSRNDASSQCLDAVELTDQMLASAENATVFSRKLRLCNDPEIEPTHGCCRPCRKTVASGLMRYFATPRSIFCRKSRRRAAVTFRRAKSTGVRSHSARRVPMRIRYSLLSNWSIMTLWPGSLFICPEGRPTEKVVQHRDPRHTTPLRTVGQSYADCGTSTQRYFYGD